MALEHPTIALWITLICFVLGVALVVYGTVDAAVSTYAKKKDAAGAKLAEAAGAADQAQIMLAGQGAGPDALAAGQAQAAASEAEKAKTALEQAAGIIASLPESARFPGMLILVGTILIGVATVQFGGVALF